MKYTTLKQIRDQVKELKRNPLVRVEVQTEGQYIGEKLITLTAFLDYISKDQVIQNYGGMPTLVVRG